MTVERIDDAEMLEKEGLEIKGVNCEVKTLQNRVYVVSFMHLPAYMEDKEIIEKLKEWGVTPISTIKRRVYQGTKIEDGTRFVRSRFPREVISLPYSTRLDTAEGPQYFRVMHSHQVKICRLCMCPGHILKDCPEFICYKCEERGHFAKNCKAVKCPDCDQFLNKCECWYNEDTTNVDEQMHERDNEKEQEQKDANETEDATTRDKEEQKEEQNIMTEQVEQEKTVEMQSAGVEEEENNVKDTHIVEQSMEGQESKEQSHQPTQGKETEGLQSSLDVLDSVDYEMEGEEQQNKEENWEKITGGSTRLIKRRQRKEIPNTDGVKKKVRNKDLFKNRYEMLKDLEEMK